jgi:hypothetical protein
VHDGVTYWEVVIGFSFVAIRWKPGGASPLDWHVVFRVAWKIFECLY